MVSFQLMIVSVLINFYSFSLFLYESSSWDKTFILLAFMSIYLALFSIVFYSYSRQTGVYELDAREDMRLFRFEKADKVYWHDKVMAATILRLIPKFILPNHVTVFRLLATPLVVILMLYEHYIIGFVAFLFVAFTDAIDGSMARTRGQITDWGRLYDPLADKILIGSMIFVIVLRYIDFWTSMLIIFLELVVIVTAWIRKKEGRCVEANLWGKIKMHLQVYGVTILLFAVIFNWDALFPFATGTLYLAITFAVISLLTQGI